MSKESKPSYKDEVLPWFCGLFLGRVQNSKMRVSEVCKELIYAVNNRLITARRSTLLRRNEVLVVVTARGEKVLAENTNNRLTFPPEIGCDDESLDRYFSHSSPVSIEELISMQSKTSTLDELFDHFSVFEGY